MGVHKTDFTFVLGFRFRLFSLFLILISIFTVTIADAAPRQKASYLLQTMSGRVIKAKSVLQTSQSGSLLKPFTAMYLLDLGIDAEKKIFCPGNKRTISRINACWYHKGHKDVNLVTAIGLSCNHYFYSYANTNTIRLFYNNLTIQYGFPVQDFQEQIMPDHFIGDRLPNPASIMILMRMYAQLLNSTSQKAKIIKQGLRQSLKTGTLKPINKKASKIKNLLLNYGKTGTSYEQKSKVGIVFLAFTYKRKKLLLIYRQHGYTGAQLANKQVLLFIKRYIRRKNNENRR